MRGRRGDERGSITAFVAVVAVAVVMVAGMAYDGGQVIATQARARSVADKAARAGAQAIDITQLRSTGTPVLDPGRARAAALEYLRRTANAGTVEVDDASVTVRVSIVQPMRILPVRDRTVVAVGRATAVDEATP